MFTRNRVRTDIEPHYVEIMFRIVTGRTVPVVVMMELRTFNESTADSLSVLSMLHDISTPRTTPALFSDGRVGNRDQ